jgi:asparagine synthase (glutamine-hydrolysing)
MPGIAGLISRRPPDECRRLTEQMLGSMQHEPFYTSGSYSAPDLGVFAGWVALKGSFADCQPVVSSQEDIVLLLAGECFSSSRQSATRLIEEYEATGDHFVTDVNGLFGGLLIDKLQQRAVLFNDRYGMERIYYHESADDFFFASEAKALLRVLPGTRAFDEQGLAEFLRYGCTLDEKTLFRDIRLLPGASLWTFTGKMCSKRRYFDVAAWESQPVLDAASFEARYQEAFHRILPRYFQSDSQLGISLTGGLDTRMIMACRPKTGPPLTAYTFSSGDGETLDVQLAARVASACRVPHQVLSIDDDFFLKFASLADRTVYLTDGCFGICGAHEIYLNNLARGLSPIRLTGNFGSEVLRGMTTLKPVNLAPGLLDGDLRQCPAGDTAELARCEAHPVSFAVFREIPRLHFGVVRAGQSQIAIRTPYLDNEIIELAYRVPEQLRSSPKTAASLVRAFDTALDRIPTDRGMVPASRLASLVRYPWYRTSFKLDYWSNEGMPHWLLPLESNLARFNRLLHPHKYLHYRSWFRRRLAGYVQDRLMDSSINRHGRWKPAFLKRLADDHARGQMNYVREIDVVITLHTIDRLLLKEA